MNTVIANAPMVDDKKIRELGRQALPAIQVTGQKRVDLINKIKHLLKETGDTE